MTLRLLMRSWRTACALARRPRRGLAPASVLALALLVPAPSAGQTATATLFVQARDIAGTPLAGVQVHVRNTATGSERVLDTDAVGTATVPLLPAGVYTASGSRQGFKQAVVEGVRLDPGAKATLLLSLEPGAYTETVTVTADATRLRAGNTASTDAFDSRTLVMVPVETRDFVQFVYQAPGAAPPAPGSRLSGEGNTGVNVSGAREAANNFLLDGVDNNDLFLNRIVVTPSLDAVQEFTVVQNTYDAEYGRNAGAQVNVVLKSGGRDTHGSVFDYARHEALDARGAFDPPGAGAPLFRRQQFGGTLGGPIARRGGFYFASVEGLRQRAEETRVTTVPTREALAGDFSGRATPIRDPFTGEPFPGNRIPAEWLDPVGVRLASLYPAPNRPGAAENYLASPAGTRDGLQFAVKTDHRLPGNTPLFLRYARSSDDRRQPFQERGHNLPGFGLSVTDVGQNAAAGLSQTWSPRVLNELRVGWNRLIRDNLPSSHGTDAFAALGIAGPALPDIDRAYPSFTLAGYEPLGDDPNLPVSRRTTTWHVSDSITIERGRSVWKLGGEIRRYRSDGYNHLFARGQVSFDGVYTGDALADLLLGLPTVSLLARNDNFQRLETTSWDAFVQHDWRPTATITVNAGVRYELNAPPVDARDRMRVFDLATRTLRDVGRDGIPRSGVRTDWNNVAPRAALAWVLPHTRNTTLRAGYGWYYDAGTLIENSALYFNPPYFDLGIYVPIASPITLADPFPAGQAIQPLPSVNTLAPDFPNAVTRQGSLGLERRVGGFDVLARYVTADGRHLVRRRNLNQPLPGPGALDDRRPIPGYGDILLIEPAAASSYDALQVRVDRNRPSGVSVRAAYTWSKSIDDTSAFLQSEGNDNTPQDARHPGAERGLSDFDVRHRASVALIWMVPGGRSAWTRQWQVSGLLAAQSGRPFTPRVSFDNSNTGNIGASFGFDRPNEVDPATAPAGAVSYDGRAFAIASPYTFGNAGRNILIGPAFASLDLAVGRAFSVKRRRLEVRLEVYNAFNRANLGLPESFVDRPTFGRSLSAAPPRQAQLVGRLEF